MEKKQNLDKGNWKSPKSPSIIQEYSQETSFHGLRQIGEETPFPIRRLIWVILFIGGASIFLIQMTTSIEFFLQWPVSVDIKINYNDSIVFPAVTICNSNAFSATKAYHSGSYSLIDDLFGPEEYADLEKYNASQMTMFQLYETLGHSRSDLIVSCEWNGHPCTEHDFTVTMTDYGRCFTFNSGKYNEPIKKTQEPGADGGLKVQLNIEQYKYMHGPNDGAGLKILVHNHDDVPQVRDYGLAVPPGSRASVAVKAVEINNLEPRHGKCNNSVEHSELHQYTVSRCTTDCKMAFLREHCGCRDIYMESVQEPTRVCSIETYQNCGRDTLKNYNKATDICDCPIPCHRLLYEPIISYSSASNFDIEALLRNNRTGTLEEAYISGREITERVNRDIAQDNFQLTNELNHTVESLNEAFDIIKTEARNLSDIVQSWYEVLQNRAGFHLDRGLDAVEYIFKHDFVRGFEVYDERAFHYVTLDFMGFASTLKRTWERASSRLDVNDTNTRELVIFPVLDMIAGQSELLDRAAEFVENVREAYLTGKPLLTFRLTYNRRYDMDYIHLPLLQIQSSRLVTNCDETIEALDRMHLGLNLLKNVSEEIIQTGKFNESRFNYGEDRYESGARQFNYRMFQFNSKVVSAPLEEIEKRLEEFRTLNYTLHETVESVLSNLDQLLVLLDTLQSSSWRDIKDVSKLLSGYLTDWNILKTPISRIITTKKTEESLRSVSTYFSDIRLRMSMLQDSFIKLESCSMDMWSLMLSEESVKQFYKAIYEDCQDFLTTDENDELYFSIFAFMLRISKDVIREMSPEEIIVRMNCDFHVLNTSTVLDRVRQQFDDMKDTVNLARHIGATDELFLEIFRTVNEEHQKFISDSKIDSSFYRSNFMNLEVFMQELSYEEINQQVAYDLTQLLSDIGGSMGLFMGGSVLSVFEFLDAFIHRGLRIALNR